MPTVDIKKKKSKGKKIVAIVISVLVAVVIIGIAVINAMVKPVDVNSDKAVYVGGMLTSDSIEYNERSADGLSSNLIVKIMQVVWKSCSSSDAKKHAKQTPPDVVMKKDVPYLDDGNLYHMLDVYYPQNTPKDAELPVIIDIHGGGWMYATKDLNEYYCRALADRGYVVFNISYRLVPDVTVTDQLRDVAMALNWISDNMSDYPCGDSIMLTGDSAGGMLCAYTTIISQSEDLQKTFGVDKVNLTVDAVLLTSPVAYMKDGAMSVYTKLMWGKDYKKAPTYDYMNFDEIIDYGTMPPTYLITSTGDSMANAQTHKMAQLLQSKGVDTTIRDYKPYNGKKLPHVFSVLEPFDTIGRQTIDDAMAFYQRIINTKQLANK